MLSEHLIRRHFRTRRFEPLLVALASNGQVLPRTLRRELAGHPVCATGLALRRLTELTWRATDLTDELVDFLLTHQQADGTWRGEPLATAVALAGLHRAAEQFAAVPERVEMIAAARRRGLAALAAMQTEDGLFEMGEGTENGRRACTAAYICSLLTADAAFREAVRFDELMAWFDRHARQLDGDTRTLVHLAQLDQSSTVPASRALAAVAA